MFKNLSIGTKISMGFGIFLITILGINIGSYRDLHNMQGYIHEISARIAPSLNTSQEMIVAMESAYHHANQYSEDRTDKDTFTKACMDYDAAYHRLKAMLTGRPESLKRLELSNTAFQRFKDISKKNPGQDARSLTAKRQEAFSESRAYMDEIIVSLNALFEDTGRQAQGYVAGAAGFTIYFTIFSFIISILLAWFFTRMITRPLAGVIDGLGNIAHGEGDLTMRLEVQGKDELGILALRFNEFIEYMERLIKEIASISTDLQNATDEVSSGAQGLSGATQEQTSAIEEVSA
ncbi:MAG: HAMP domain-containing protein, partial [Thermodesulfobacteriota bacterium]|nr:HAMP domain-containing protein [Thermodesulfobacteriota bacterium]